MRKHLALYDIVEIMCLDVRGDLKPYMFGELFSMYPLHRMGSSLGVLGLWGTSLPPSQRTFLLLALRLWWQCPVVLVPEEISELLHHILPGWETLAGMAAFKHLINIQIYSSHFNLNSMHIIK